MPYLFLSYTFVISSTRCKLPKSWVRFLTFMCVPQFPHLSNENEKMTCLLEYESHCITSLSKSLLPIVTCSTL